MTSPTDLLRSALRRQLHFHCPKFHDKHHVVHWLHDHLHMAYFAGVYIEGHSVYAQIAGVLFLLTVLGVFVTTEELGH